MTDDTTMIFGDKATFAIEAMIEPTLQAPSTAWGRICIWCEHVSIGRINEPHCGIGSVFYAFSLLIQDLDELWCDEFDGMTDLELMNCLDGKLYGHHGSVEIEDSRTLEEMRADGEKYGSFSILTNWVESFDGCGKSFIIQSPKGQLKILNTHQLIKRGFSLSTTTEAFCFAITEAICWFDREQTALGEAWRN